MAKDKNNVRLRQLMEQAQGHIKKGEYKEARRILEAIDKKVDNPTVKSWLAKLDKVAPKDDLFGDMQFPDVVTPQLAQKKGLVRRLGEIAAVVLLALCGLSVLGAMLNGSNPDNAPTATAPSQGSAQEEIPTANEPTSIPSDTPIPSATNTPAPTTNTPQPTATITPTPLPTNTPVPTNTRIPPTPIPPIIFSSGSNGMQPVIGPVDIPTGFYEVTVTTSGFFIGEIETVSGTCNTDMMGLFNLSDGIANNGAENWFASENCRALIQISNTQQPWTLEFRAMGPQDIQPVAHEYYSSQEGLYAVIGPVVFEDGRYRATVTTSGFFIGSLETVEGTCDSGFMGLFNLSSGQANSGAQNLITTRECVAILVVGNTQQPWTLTFEQLQ